MKNNSVKKAIRVFKRDIHAEIIISDCTQDKILITNNEPNFWNIVNFRIIEKPTKKYYRIEIKTFFRNLTILTNEPFKFVSEIHKTLGGKNE